MDSINHPQANFIKTSATQFTASRSWGSVAVAQLAGADCQLHWANSQYPWHQNDDDELFVVLAGAVDMYYRLEGVEQVTHLTAGDVFFMKQGFWHSAKPVPEARILVLEPLTK